MNAIKIKSFTDLIAWKEAHNLVIMIYKTTKLFPKDELFSLTNQIKRASVSISSNIAEGFSRRSNLEKKQFYYLSLGSLIEVQNQILISRDVGYIDNKTFQEIAEKTVTVGKLINSLLKYIKSESN